MSGTTVAYGDRQITRDGFATPEFLQFLERLARQTHNIRNDSAAQQAQIAATATTVSTLEAEIATLNARTAPPVRRTRVGSLSMAPSGGSETDADLQGQIQALANRTPVESALAPADAIALTSGTPAELVQLPLRAGLHVLMGTVYLTGAGSVTLARASVSLTTATIDTAPGSFATGWFGGGASPGSLGMDLTIGTFVGVRQITHIASVPTIGHLNVNATFSGAISGYGNLIAWPLGA